MAILTSTLQAAFRSFRDYRARREVARTLAELDDEVLKDIGIGTRFPYAMIHAHRRHSRKSLPQNIDGRW